jgi:alkanesulfonate monooxygenase SsuD/methylene tetrahydromethanopterin reductase-like flavin-dependent oxidoreductase (luciferase family)
MTAEGSALPRSIVFATDALEPLPELARAAEANGFYRVWSTEYVNRDAVARALAIALGTSSIGVGTGITYAFTRLPLAMAALAADVQRLAQGRFALGISSGTRGVRRWYGAEFDPPARRIAAYTEQLREAWAKNPDLPDPPPVYAAALNPVMVRWVAGACDGVLLHALALSRTHLRERVLPALERGADGRSQRPRVAAWCVTAIDSDEERARELARRQLAFYLSTPSYATVAEGTSWASVASAVHRAFEDSGRRASWRDLSPLIPDEVLDELTITGTPAPAPARAARVERELADLGVTELVFQTAGADVSDQDLVASCRHIIEALGEPSLSGAASGAGHGAASH